MLSEEEVRREYAIIEKARGDLSAFAPLYEQYFDSIFTYIYRQTDDEELAADLCSQTFLKALSNLHRFEYRGIPVSAWLYRIATNEVNKYYRRKKRTPVFSLEEVRLKELLEPSADTWDEDLIQRMLVYLKELPTELIRVLELRFFENRDFKEIAYILGITESGAKMRTYRALDRLRRKFNLKIKYDAKK